MEQDIGHQPFAHPKKPPPPDVDQEKLTPGLKEGSPSPTPMVALLGFTTEL